MVQRLQQTSGFGSRRNVAGVLVFEADGYAVNCGLIREAAERLHHPCEALFRLDRPPVREDPNNARAGSFRDLPSSQSQAWLVGEGVLGCEDVLLETFVYGGRIRQNTFEQRGGNRNNFM